MTASFAKAVCRVDLSDEPYYIETQSDFQRGLFAQRSRLTHIYHYTVLAVALLKRSYPSHFSWYLARPLKLAVLGSRTDCRREYDKRIPIQNTEWGQ